MVSGEVTDLKKELSVKEKQINLHKKKVKKTEKKVIEQKKINEDLILERKILRDKLKKHADLYFIEMRKALSTAVLAAFAFLMALSWREYISEVVNSFIIKSPMQGKLINAILVTCISVIGIIIVTRLLSVKES